MVLDQLVNAIVEEVVIATGTAAMMMTGLAAVKLMAV